MKKGDVYRHFVKGDLVTVELATDEVVYWVYCMDERPFVHSTVRKIFDDHFTKKED